MEKILLLVDQKGLNKSAFEFACYLADLTRSTLTGVFIDPEPSPASRDLQAVYSEVYIGLTPVIDDLPEDHWKTKLAENKRAFALACGNKGIRWSDQVSPVSSVSELVRETRFADLLVVNAETSLSESVQEPPTEFVKEVLVHSECPVVIAPLNFTGIEEVLFAYDGSASAVYAIKQFTYLFPKLSDIKTVFLEVNDEEESKITDQEKIGEYLKMHYSAIGFQLLHGNASDELFSHLIGKKNIFVVTGAYGRKLISSFFKKSTAELLLKTTNLPVFITHH